MTLLVTPAQAGVQGARRGRWLWIPAFAGMTIRPGDWALVLQLHALLHAGPRPDPLAPGLQVPQPGIVWQGPAPGVDRIDGEIGRGDLVTREVLRLLQLQYLTGDEIT